MVVTALDQQVAHSLDKCQLFVGFDRSEVKFDRIWMVSAYGAFVHVSNLPEKGDDP